MSKLFNKENFEFLIETIENYGPSWLDMDNDCLDDQWHSGCTHSNPEILKSFGFQCVMKADLMVSVKMAEDYAKEKTTNKVFEKHNETKQQPVIQIKNKKEIN